MQFKGYTLNPFQVQAADLIANALLGNYGTGPAGASLSVDVVSGTARVTPPRPRPYPSWYRAEA